MVGKVLVLQAFRYGHESHPQNPINKPDVAGRAHNPNAGETERGEPLKLIVKSWLISGL